MVMKNIQKHALKKELSTTHSRHSHLSAPNAECVGWGGWSSAPGAAWTSRSRLGGRSLWSGGRCVVISRATAGGGVGGVGPGGAFGFVLVELSVDSGDGRPQVLPMDFGAVPLPQRSGERASGG